MSSNRITKRCLFTGAAGLGVAAAMPSAARAEGAADIASGPFSPTWESLVAGYSAPEWFRDAKFGLWAHWGPQCVGATGDWHARLMYMQGSTAYEHHVKTYGHPADTGFIDYLARWKGEKWDPEAQLDLYSKAGAKYFAVLANHHDNFDSWDSKYQPWNSMRVGPKKDIVGIYAKAARARGMKFATTIHSAHAWHWLQPAYGYDAEGPRRGERYDAFRLTREMGAGKFWEGLDPRALYGTPRFVVPDGLSSIAETEQWHEMNDRVWDEYPPAGDPAYTRKWFLRSKDLIDSYKPDLVYFDDFDLPLGQTGLDIAAHYYNSSLQWHGKLEGVITIKNAMPQHRPAVVEDVELGYRAAIEPLPWQTDTCLGHWFYSQKIYDDGTYMSAASVIHRLCEVVSKNGNLLLSVPMRGHGSIDVNESTSGESVASWMARFSEAIFGTRPWKIAGEGPTQVISGQFGEKTIKPFTAQDIRFTTKGGALYAMTLGKPTSETVTLKSLAHANVARVEVVGSRAPLTWTQDDDGLHVRVPSRASHEYGVALKINGRRLA